METYLSLEKNEYVQKCHSDMLLCSFAKHSALPVAIDFPDGKPSFVKNIAHMHKRL